MAYMPEAGAEAPCRGDELPRPAPAGEGAAVRPKSTRFLGRRQGRQSVFPPAPASVSTLGAAGDQQPAGGGAAKQEISRIRGKGTAMLLLGKLAYPRAGGEGEGRG
jgi:hypothetical protein